MRRSRIFSNSKELKLLAKVLSASARLPCFLEGIPGAVMESVLAYVRGGAVLKTYDFVDVIKSSDRCGWQVKSTQHDTPVTWKRAKIPNSRELIEKSYTSTAGSQSLGNAIIEFCNAHVIASLDRYDLNEIGYARLIVHANGEVTYFEKLLRNRKEPRIFNAKDFTWRWSDQKETKKKEQLQSFTGTHISTGEKWFAWHGLGENQLHFSGEYNWWPGSDSRHAVTFHFPTPEEKIDFEKLVGLLS